MRHQVANVACACFAALLLGGAQAEPDDPLKSDGCRRALDAVQQREADAAAAPASGASSAQHSEALARLTTQRKEAARICLGSRGDPPPLPQHLNQAPVAVPPVTFVPPPAPRPLPAPPPGAPVQLPAPPAVITGCDSIGCWTSDGKRLDRVGPNLLGPRGQCMVHGATVSCP